MAWSDPAAGQTITAAKVVELATYGVPLTVTKTSTTSRNSTTTSTADSELTLTLPANRTYEVYADLHITSDANAAGDFRCRWAWTNTATVTCKQAGNDTTLASGSAGTWIGLGIAADTVSPTTDTAFGASTTETVARFWADVVTGGSDVVLTLEWAQSSSNASNTNLKLGSTMRARRIA